MEEKKVKSYTNFSMIVFILLIICGCLCALLVYQVMQVSLYVDINIYVFDVIVLIVGYIFATTLYYVGKLIMGKLSGYRLISFNLWFLNIVRDDKNKLVVKRGGFSGLGCKVYMAPKKDNPNYKLYLLGGTIFSLPIFIICWLVALLIKNPEVDVKYYLLFISGFIPFIILANLIPLRFDSNSDGFILRLIHADKTPDNYHRTLKQLEALTNGKSELKYYDISSPKTPFDLDTLYYNYYYLIDHEEFTKANRVCETLIENTSNINDLSKIYLGYTGKIYELCRQKRFEESDRYFWELKHDIRKVVRNKWNFESLKICLYVAAYMETNYDEYLNLYYRKDKLSKRYSYFCRAKLEEKIIDDTIKAIQVDHPDWYVE